MDSDISFADLLAENINELSDLAAQLVPGFQDDMAALERLGRKLAKKIVGAALLFLLLLNRLLRNGLNSSRRKPR
jgi:hypothetical protein